MGLPGCRPSSKEAHHPLLTSENTGLGWAEKGQERVTLSLRRVR